MAITSFTHYFAFLSNFWPSRVILDGVGYPTVEHAYQAAKTFDPEIRLHILECVTPGETKRIGKRLALRENWDNIRVSIMEDLVRQKFTKNESLKKSLLTTYENHLEEGNTWNDTFWGVCNGVGENNLGKILMKVRKEISNGI